LKFASRKVEQQPLSSKVAPMTRVVRSIRLFLTIVSWSEVARSFVV
jgi:hypothetical protein